MAEPPLQQKHILVVDDEPTIRFSVQLLLKEAGYVVDEAASGTEALAMFEPGKYDMIFTDFLMPKMCGDELAATIKKLSPNQRVVMLTAFPEMLRNSGYPLAGVDSIICKPFGLDTLLWAIHRFAAN
jgi:CheY-like chemotaxis protein